MKRATTFRRLRGTVAIVAVTALLSGCISVEFGRTRTQPLVESAIRGTTGPKILMVDIDGMISEEAREGGLLRDTQESTVARIREELDRARRDPEVRALVVRINSPGGTVTASDILYKELIRFKREKSVPVVAQLMGLATSGAYYAAMAADTVLAEPTSVTGSIGVLFLGLNFSGLMKKAGIADQTLVAGSNKDAGSWLRPMKRSERAQLQSVLDDMHERFKRVVSAGRPELTKERIGELADGRIYSAEQALANGLVDALGGLPEAFIEAEKRAGLTSSRVVAYHRPHEWKQNFYSGPLVPARIQVEVDWLPGLGRPGFLYLWAPGAF